MTDTDILIADIGGTNARFALARAGSGYSRGRTVNCSDFVSADVAIDHYLASVDLPIPSGICIAAAGPVIDQCVSFTNNSWTLSGNVLSGKYNGIPVAILNDFEAVAYSLPELSADDCMSIGKVRGKNDLGEDFTVAATGPGTGLGHSILLGRGGVVQAIKSEFGHASFAPKTSRQREVWSALTERSGHVSNEGVVSGRGIENLYRALSAMEGESVKDFGAADIFKLGINGSDERATEAVQMFFELFGQMAGDFALSVMATDGIFIAGGIIRRYALEFEKSLFRVGFENKGSYRSLMQRIPTRLIMHEASGLLGASAYARSMVDR